MKPRAPDFVGGRVEATRRRQDWGITPPNGRRAQFLRARACRKLAGRKSAGSRGVEEVRAGAEEVRKV
jgi:hypothetical protein